MIFLDESGKRWKRIKHSTIGVGVLISLSLAVLLAGSVAYNPQWGVLPQVQHAAGAVLAAAAGTGINTTKTLTNNGTIPTPKKTFSTTRTVAYQSALANAVTTSASIASPSPTATPRPTATPAPTPRGNPIENDYGIAHKPIR